MRFKVSGPDSAFVANGQAAVSSNGAANQQAGAGGNAATNAQNGANSAATNGRAQQQGGQQAGAQRGNANDKRQLDQLLGALGGGNAAGGAAGAAGGLGGLLGGAAGGNAAGGAAGGLGGLLGGAAGGNAAGGPAGAAGGLGGLLGGAAAGDGAANNAATNARGSANAAATTGQANANNAAANERGGAQAATTQAAKNLTAAAANNATNTGNVTVAAANGTAANIVTADAANVNAGNGNANVNANETDATNAAAAGATATTANGAMGLNVLLHGDGGQSFFDFPNQNVQGNLMGMVILAPDPNLFWGGGQGLQRTDGVAHSQAVADLITNVMPQVVNFDPNQVLFTGVSGGALMLSGFFIPAQMQQFPNSAVLLNCGGLEPQVDFVDPNVLATTTIHHQSTQRELANLQQSIPVAVTAYEQAARAAGLNDDQINALQTVNNAPDGGHCAMDGQGFVSGIQLMADSYSAVMQGGNGEVQGVGNVRQGVVGQQLTFGQAERKL